MFYIYKVVDATLGEAGHLHFPKCHPTGMTHTCKPPGPTNIQVSNIRPRKIYIKMLPKRAVIGPSLQPIRTASAFSGLLLEQQGQVIKQEISQLYWVKVRTVLKWVKWRDTLGAQDRNTQSKWFFKQRIKKLIEMSKKTRVQSILQMDPINKHLLVNLYKLTITWEDKTAGHQKEYTPHWWWYKG